MAETPRALVRRPRKRAGMTRFQPAERAGSGERTTGRIANDKPFDHPARAAGARRPTRACEAGTHGRQAGSGKAGSQAQVQGETQVEGGLRGGAAGGGRLALLAAAALAAAAASRPLPRLRNRQRRGRDD
ncbi:hypothetical protein [Actinacidiphila reveromycinica]|uniref:hypothetical protein n=1 Tax=Actinacidiphila reveromycinica TaxID=659352 RepID=UPI001F437D69|nr:hypothetical protein [Streptomyces sp. SN-593]